MSRVVISAITVFFISAGVPVVGLILLLRKYGDKPDWMLLLACLIYAFILAMKDVRSNMNMPPLDNGNQNALNQFMKLIEQQQKSKDENGNKSGTG